MLGALDRPAGAGFPTERQRRSPLDGRMDNPCGLPTRPPTGRRLPTSSTGPHHHVVAIPPISTRNDEEPEWLDHNLLACPTHGDEFRKIRAGAVLACKNLDKLLALSNERSSRD
jgi:hypothetical protein